jgi:hypothetical protein
MLLYTLPIPGILSKIPFSIHIHVYTEFAIYLPSYTLSLPPLTGANFPDRTCSVLLFPDFVQEKTENKKMSFLLV